MAVVLSCLHDLFAACPTSGACSSNATDGGPATLYCYADGVQADQTSNPTCNGGSIVTHVRKPDGSPCYTQEVSITDACELYTTTWRDPSGAVVATEQSAIFSKTVTCAGSGETFTCTDPTVDTPCLLGPLEPNLNCQPGVCP
jgi:hypothetical protein